MKLINNTITNLQYNVITAIADECSSALWSDIYSNYYNVAFLPIKFEITSKIIQKITKEDRL